MATVLAMNTQQPSLQGVHLPLVTPFLDGAVDFASLDRMLDRYLGTGIASLVLLGTTGESSVLDARESLQVTQHIAERTRGALPLILGVSGNNTRAVVDELRSLDQLPVDAYLVTTPYYNRPSQAGLIAHFDAVARETSRDIVVYNIPYRTGVNLSNESLFHLLDRHDHIIGIKDSCGDVKQSMELLREGRDRLAILAGDDHMFFTNVALGGAGGILAASHIATESFVRVFNDLVSGQLVSARAMWDQLSRWIPLLFIEPNPAPLKFVLALQGLITSPECRLPLTPVSEELREQIRERVLVDSLPEVTL